MKEFLFVFRANYNEMPKASPEEMQVTTQKWINWISEIAAKGNLADRGNRLVNTGKVSKGNGIILDGPFTEIKESILGYSIVKANSLEEAAKHAEDCPVYKTGGNVEIREIDKL